METISYVELSQDMFVSWHKRLLTLVIDIAVFFLIILVIGFIGGLLALAGYDGLLLWFDQMDGLTDRVFSLSIMVTYLFAMEVLTQRTVGKYITGTMVVMEDGSRPEARAIIIRALCRIITLEALTFLSAYPRGWHDSASNTYVVDAKKYKAAVSLKDSFEEIGMQEV